MSKLNRTGSVNVSIAMILVPFKTDWKCTLLVIGHWNFGLKEDLHQTFLVFTDTWYCILRVPQNTPKVENDLFLPIP